MRNFPFSRHYFGLPGLITFICYYLIAYFAGKWVCRKDDDSFETYAPLFTSLPLLAAFSLSRLETLWPSMIACCLTSLILTTLIGNLRLTSCLILSIISPVTFYLSHSLGSPAQTP